MKIKRTIRFSAAYQRFHIQLKALQLGNLRMVRKLAADAKAELEMRRHSSQLRLLYSR